MPSPRALRPTPLLLSVLAVAALVAVSATMYGCGEATARDADAAELAYRSSVGTPPADYDGPVFVLSDDYPAENPGPCSVSDCPWLITHADSFAATFPPAPPADTTAAGWDNSMWPDYMNTLKDYIREGQTDDLNNATGFVSEVGGETRWYHVPWMAYDPTVGREFAHGTTNERTSTFDDLFGNDSPHGVGSLPGVAAECANGFETWAVGMYNEYGGYALGQSWGADGGPVVDGDEGVEMPAGLPFPEGTLVTKFLFTTATPDCVDFLEGSPVWTVNRHRSEVQPVDGEETNVYLCERTPQEVRLVQVDVAVVDANSPTRWVYGTYAFDGNAPGATVWDKLVPVGVQWGSDPWTFPAVPASESRVPQQSVLNKAMVSDPVGGIYEHFGCNGRLAGPVDNKESSCMSCHASAYAAGDGAVSVMGSNTPASFGFDGLCEQYSQENVDYFQNNVAPATYSGGQYAGTLSMDTSLQMWVAFSQYGQFNTAGEPSACKLDEKARRES